MLKKDTSKLQVKDLVTIGVFSAIYFVINLIIMICGGISPIIWIFMPALIALLSGVIFMLMIEKVQKFGPVVIMAAITAIIYFATGQFTVILLLTFASSSIISELIRYMFGYKSFTGNLIAYAVFSLGMVGSPLPIWLFGNSFFESIIEQGMSSSYVDGLRNLTSSGMLLGMIISTFVLALAGGIIGRSMLKKHFIKAGII
ncbi:MptD family putative ECF transporter S component [Clostridium beijerinckii]|uniref:MptD family putative ECF transporter S component n=1 Tax=Clostridium beijerinckii TaxID=1520 RepID=A0AAW3WEM5_CLOBE|nr:MptD family putative ECF transporter S component [Clostridium beijerinckii]MBC2459724.1 MptD family putative ECF transporter S component [Clostridium beijerinckii]MBC2477201.1 MptD family putative ECF transporter S component [Clostridium beijerinckii]NOV60737.1 energy-coupling factor transport system substrate-specific component [Clostridium beijerinckii]NOV73175.1 energy-coupling factor transport system substrate-specific component [Clostridium beijerinckii]NOW33403.1 energy-coupling facto